MGKYWPFAPVRYTDKLGLKACVFDNTGDGDFYKTSKYLAQEWRKLGNPTESHFASGGHCQNIPYSEIVKCLEISGSSPRPPAPAPRPTPPSPSPAPTPLPPHPPRPSPSPDQPPAACQECFAKDCPKLQGSGSQACKTCVRRMQWTCAPKCMPFP